MIRIKQDALVNIKSNMVILSGKPTVMYFPILKNGINNTRNYYVTSGSVLKLPENNPYGGWGGSEPIAYSHYWVVNGIERESNEQGELEILSPTWEGLSASVIITASNSYGVSSISQTIVLGKSYEMPEIYSVSISRDESNQMLLNSDISINEDNIQTVSYQWKKNNNNINFATGETYTITSSDASSFITLQITIQTYLYTIQETSNTFNIGTIIGSASLTLNNTYFTVNLSVFGNGGSLSYQWFKNDILIENEINSYYYPNEDGDYKCKITITDGSWNNSIETENYTYSAPIFEFYYANILSDNDGQDYLYATYSASDYNYSFYFQWFKDGIEIEGETNDYIYPTEPGVYKYTITADDPNNTYIESEQYGYLVDLEPTPPILIGSIDINNPENVEYDGFRIFPGWIAECPTGEWENEPTSFEYEWYLADDLEKTNLTIIPDESTSSINILVDWAGKFLFCKITAINDDGETEEWSSAETFIEIHSGLPFPGGPSDNFESKIIKSDYGTFTLVEAANVPFYPIFGWIDWENPSDPSAIWEISNDGSTGWVTYSYIGPHFESNPNGTLSAIRLDESANNKYIRRKTNIKSPIEIITTIVSEPLYIENVIDEA